MLNDNKYLIIMNNYWLFFFYNSTGVLLPIICTHALNSTIHIHTRALYITKLKTK